jgi:pimeloyl-ACP methyl ester carboxylesterase
MTAFKQIKLLIITILLNGYLYGCLTINQMKPNEEKNFKTTIWQNRPRDQKPIAVVVLAHGLNLKPNKMDDWAQILSSNGALVIRFSLYGHTGNPSDMANVHQEIWRKQFDEVMSVASVTAKNDNLPIYLVAFSLGALVGLEWQAHAQEHYHMFEKMVLIAPALSLPWYSKPVINMLSILGHSLMLPSRSPSRYRANPGTSIAAYQSLFALKKSLEEKKYKNANVKTLVLIDRHDELVNSKGIKKIIEGFKLNHWALQIVNNRFAHHNYGFRHLMVDQDAMGKELWQSLSKMVLHHLKLES